MPEAPKRASGLRPYIVVAVLVALAVTVVLVWYFGFRDKGKPGSAGNWTAEQIDEKMRAILDAVPPVSWMSRDEIAEALRCIVREVSLVYAFDDPVWRNTKGEVPSKEHAGVVMRAAEKCLGGTKGKWSAKLKGALASVLSAPREGASMPSAPPEAASCIVEAISKQYSLSEALEFAMSNLRRGATGTSVMDAMPAPLRSSLLTCAASVPGLFDAPVTALVPSVPPPSSPVPVPPTAPVQVPPAPVYSSWTAAQSEGIARVIASSVPSLSGAEAAAVAQCVLRDVAPDQALDHDRVLGAIGTCLGGRKGNWAPKLKDYSVGLLAANPSVKREFAVCLVDAVEQKYDFVDAVKVLSDGTPGAMPPALQSLLVQCAGFM
jgi:hypothetical protein